MNMIEETMMALVATCGLLCMILGCGEAPKNIYTIGVVYNNSIHKDILEGFKTGMVELGYVEGESVEYICRNVIENDERSVSEEIECLLSLKIDLLLTMRITYPSVKILKGSETPVLAVACSEIVERGIVKDLQHPGGNVTGVQVADSTLKALEMLLKMSPGTKKVYLPYNPDEQVSVLFLNGLDEAAEQLGIELVLDEVHTVEEVIAAILSPSYDIDAVFRIPSSTLGPRNRELSLAAIERGIPMGAAMPQDDLMLMYFSSESFPMGKQAARLADQIHRGVKPSDLPVEIAEAFLTVNLKTAEKIGLEVPYDVLMQAKTILR